MTHDEVVAAITSACDELGYWYWTATDRSPAQKAGWVDVVILTGKSAMFAEVKSEDGRVTREQTKVGRLLTRAGLTYRLVRPITLDGFLTELASL